MKKILILMLLLCLFGCSSTKHDIEKTDFDSFSKQLVEKLKNVVPLELYNELNEKGTVSQVNNTISISNAKEDPTLRVDFTYKDDKLVQFVIKEYGFTEDMKDNSINENEAKLLTQIFAKVFLNEEVNLTKIDDLSVYETGYHITLKDQYNNIYLVQLNKNLVMKYIDHNQY